MSTALPELFEARAQLASAQRDDRINAGDGPVHPGAFAPRSDGEFATGLDDPSRGTQPSLPELRVAHALAVAFDIVDALARLVIPSASVVVGR